MSDSTIDTTKILDVANEYVRLENEKDELEKQLGVLKPKIKAMQELLVPMMIQADWQNIKTNNGTVVMYSQLWVKPMNKDKESLICALLTDPDTEFLARNLNISQLSSWVREFVARKEIDPVTLEPLLPEHLKGLIEINTEPKVKCIA